MLLARGGTKRSEANVRSGAETDEEAKDRKSETKGGGSFGIMSALKHAAEKKEEGGLGGKIPKCRVMEWATGMELRDLIREIIGGDTCNS